MESGNGTGTGHAAGDEVPSWTHRRWVLAVVATGGVPGVEDAAAVLRERGLLTGGDPVTLTSLGTLVLDEDDGDDEPGLGAVRVPEQRSGATARSGQPVWKYQLTAFVTRTVPSSVTSGERLRRAGQAGAMLKSG